MKVKKLTLKGRKIDMFTLIQDYTINIFMLLCADLHSIYTV